MAEDIGLFTDASLEGWGVIYGDKYMAGAWPKCANGLSINELELLVVAIAAAKFGPEWARRRIVTNCDNMAAVHTINSGAARAPPLMVAMRQLYMSAARHGFEIKAKHIGTKLNVAADSASRGDWTRFFDHVQKVLNIDKSDMRQVGPNLDIEAAIRRMQKARLAHRARQGRRGCTAV